MPVTPQGEYSPYYSEAARDAALISAAYAQTVERSALEHAAYYTLRGDHAKALEMLTQSLASALTGNDGN